MTEPTEDQIYGQYFDANGQPARAGVEFTDEEAREYAQYEKHFGLTSPRIKETNR